LTCEAVIREISNFIDGDLDSALRREIEGHLKDCKDCQVIIDQTKLTVDIFCDSELVELPEDVRRRLHQALRRKMQGARR
jgi:predicted anti-sigma-YlaC factor YlaD